MVKRQSVYADPNTKKRQIWILFFTLTALGLSCAVTLVDTAWLLPAAAVSHIVLWTYVGYVLSKLKYVSYHD